jgi:hypothetical protein
MAGHPDFCAEDARHKVRQEKVGVQFLPTQAMALAEEFDRGELIIGRRIQPLRQTRWKGEGAVVLQIDDGAFLIRARVIYPFIQPSLDSQPADRAGRVAARGRASRNPS